MSKIWNKPIDDKIFDKLTEAHWKYYAYMISEDEKEEYEKYRDFVEYLARFLDNESVERIQRARKNKEEAEEEENKKAFEEILRQNFEKE